MSNLVYRKIVKEDEKQLRELIKVVLEDLERPEFFVPFSEEEIQDILDESKVIAYGAYDNEKLVGSGQLFLDEKYVEDIKKAIKIDDSKVLELGGYLVLEEYRNQGIMKKLQEILSKEAQKTGFDYAVITAHPDNVSSNSVIKHSKARLVKTMNLGEFLRNIYLLQLKEK